MKPKMRLSHFEPRNWTSQLFRMPNAEGQGSRGAEGKKKPLKAILSPLLPCPPAPLFHYASKLSCSFKLIMLLLLLGLVSACGSSGQFAAGSIYEAKAQIAVAKRAGAEELAASEFQEANRALSEAEALIAQNKEGETYRLSSIAYLKARLAEAMAIRNKAEREAEVEEAELSAAEVDLNRSRKDRKDAEEELENFSKD